MHTSQCGIYSTYTYHCLRIRRSKVEDSQNLEKVSMKMTYSKKQKITENNEKHSNRPVGRCSGPLVDIFGSMEPWTHALSKGLLGLSLNLNILGSKIEICAQNSAFLRCLECANLSTLPKKSRNPSNPRTIELHGQSHLGWYYQHTRNEKNLSVTLVQLRKPTDTGGKPHVRLWLGCAKQRRCLHCASSSGTQPKTGEELS